MFRWPSPPRMGQFEIVLVPWSGFHLREWIQQKREGSQSECGVPDRVSRRLFLKNRWKIEGSAGQLSGRSSAIKVSFPAIKWIQNIREATDQPVNVQNTADRQKLKQLVQFSRTLKSFHRNSVRLLQKHLGKSGFSAGFFGWQKMGRRYPLEPGDDITKIHASLS